jgi:hypothetical protein
MAIVAQGSPCIFDTAIDANDSTAQERLGAIRVENDGTNGEKVYMYVLASGAIANGTPCVLNGTTGYTVGPETADIIGYQRCIGVGIGTITTAYYGWIQVRGYHSAIIKDNGGSTCTTAYIETVLGCAGVRSLKYKNTTTVLNATHQIVFSDITALESLATACTTVAGYIHCM